MTDRKKAGVAAGFAAGAARGMLPGLLICVFAVWVAGRPASAGVETFLPEQDTTISGTVTAPSCQAQLETDTLTFTGRENAGSGMAEDGARNRQQLVLHLSECDFSGLGVAIKADALSDYPERGALKTVPDNRSSSRVYYTIGPGKAEYAGRPLFSLSDDSAALVKGPGGDWYFHLNQDEYWFDINASLSGGEVMNIPFDVVIHSVKGDGTDKAEDTLTARFTLQLSYR